MRGRRYRRKKEASTQRMCIGKNTRLTLKMLEEHKTLKNTQEHSRALKNSRKRDTQEHSKKTTLHVKQEKHSTDLKIGTQMNETDCATPGTTTRGENDSPSDSSASVPVLSASRLRNLVVKLEKTMSHRDFLSTTQRAPGNTSYRKGFS